MRLCVVSVSIFLENELQASEWMNEWVRMSKKEIGLNNNANVSFITAVERHGLNTSYAMNEFSRHYSSSRKMIAALSSARKLAKCFPKIVRVFERWACHEYTHVHTSVTTYTHIHMWIYLLLSEHLQNGMEE